MKAQRGIGILEAMVALLLSSTAVFVGYGAFTIVLDARARTTPRVQAMLRAATLHDELRQLLSGAHIVVGDSIHRFVLDDVDDDGAGDRMTFRTTARPPERQIVALAWLGTEADQPLVLITRNDANGGVADTTVLSRWVGGFSLRALTDAGWISSWTSAVALPRAIEIRVRSARSDSLSIAVETPLIVRLYPSQ